MAEEMVAGSISAMDVVDGDMGFMATSAVVGICRACGGSAGCLQRHRVVASTTTSSNVMPMNCGKRLVMIVGKYIIKPCYIKEIVAFDS